MFDVGFAEIFVLSVIGLLVLGPERLPKVARTIGGFVRKARLSYTSLKRTVEAELAAADAANPIKQAKDELESVKQQVSDLGKQLDDRVDVPSITPNSPGDALESMTPSDSDKTDDTPASDKDAVPDDETPISEASGSEPDDETDAAEPSKSPS